MIPLRQPDDLSNWVERSFGHVFTTPAHRDMALTHRSAGADHNERLEFLGDAVLGLTITDELYHRHPDRSEGDLAKLRASVVNTLAFGS